ncbi:MAG: M28 family peptidase [Clostridia bacterium]|nr:M28 family peptidase [Clostridia bacterium]
MLDKPMDVLREFPVRKSKKQKQAFRAAVRSYGERLGYPVTEEKAPFGARNVLFGDPDKADFLVTAHYDTPARLPFPNFITPKNIVVYLLYQITVAFLLLVPCFAMSMIVGMFAENPIWMMLTLYITMFALLWLMMAGPANKTNANDNTSGVITVLETMQALPQELREKVCFVLFDLEEAGLIGSMSYHSKHREASDRQIVLNADCVGDGDEVLLIPSRKLRKKHRALLEGWKEMCPQTGGKSIAVQDRGVCFFPSDQGNFPLGVGIAAFRRKKGLGLYCARIHTPKDTVCEENNVILIRNFLIRILEKGK